MATAWYLTSAEGSYAVSAMALGASVGTIVFGCSADKLGCMWLFLFTLKGRLPAVILR